MPSAEEKFKKLLAAYEDEVQRKQHKMGKRVEPTDVAQANPATGYCTFLRAGQTVVWSPSFDVIGTWDSLAKTWAWGWADGTLEPKIRGRIDAVRKQGEAWGIDVLTTGLRTVDDELRAWELSTVATAVSSADAMYRMIDGSKIRFLALFDGPPPSRSTSVRAPTSSTFPAGAVVRGNTPYPGVPSTRPPATPYPGTPIPSSVAARSSTTPVSAPTVRSSTRPPPNPALVRQPTPALGRQPTPMPSSRPLEKEPTDATRAEIGRLLTMNMTTSQQAEFGSVNLMARALAPAGPVGAASVEAKLILKPRSGLDVALTPSAALQDALIALWSRCRERNGLPYRFVTARLESSGQGLLTHVFLEF
ncbi:MAG: hypothetical protein NVS3B10_07730 [Polyangiales bacterium]